MLEMYGSFIGTISNALYSYILIILLVGGGIFFTLRTGFVQRLLGEAFRVIMEPAEDKDKESISAFQSMMISTASRVGTGNIAGVSTALCTGGPGAVFWMWVIAFFGMATAFVEGTLAQVYKRRGENGTCFGGPSYYIESTLKSRKLGVLYAIFMVITYMVGFNLVASFNVADSFKAFGFYNADVTPLVVGIILAAVFALCIMGGGKKIADVASFLVPIMGGLYIAAALLVTVLNIDLLPGVIRMIFADAFNFKAIFGGFAGSCVMLGIKRGLFSNEAGVGASASASGSASVSHPVKQGLVQVLSVFLDTIVICSCTALLCLCSGVEPTAEAAGMSYVQAALQNVFGQAGVVFITIALILFAFTTLIGNYFFAETGIVYLLGKVPAKGVILGVRIFAIAVVVVGAVASLGVVWDTADVLMGLMACINVPVIIKLSKTAADCLKDYTKQRKAGEKLVFKASSIGIKEETDFWN